MSRKKKNINNKTKKKDDRAPSFFDNIVLKEKKEEEKPVSVKRETKKYSEIVQGYNPNLSFADILYSYEHTGEPYSMPKPKAKQKKSEDFGSILEKWENIKDDKRPKNQSKKSEYKPTKSFADILSSYEESKNPLFKEESDDVKRSESATWSILGNNKTTSRVKEEEKSEVDYSNREYKRASQVYTPQKSFSSILDEYEGKKPLKTEEIATQKVEKEVETVEVLSAGGFFKKDDEVETGASVAWSIIGGKNESFVREEKTVKEIEKSEEKIKRSSEEYHPTKDFSEILASYEKNKAKEKIAWSFDGIKSDLVTKKAMPEIKEKPVENVKTFEEILKEKGDTQNSQRPQLTITKLRSMMPQATLDLHGETQTDAEHLIKEFLSEAKTNGLRKISIITGKGLHSENGEGVLRHVAEEILDSSGLVSEKNNAPQKAGGSGALWIILKAD